MLETLFKLRENNTSVRVEVLAGITTFGTLVAFIDYAGKFFRPLQELSQRDLFHQVTLADYIFPKDKIFAYLNLDDSELLIYDKLYAMLERSEPGPVVRLNQAVAEAMAYGPERGLRHVDALQDDLAEYPYLHAARADLLRRLGRNEESRAAYRRALDLTSNASERRFLERRLRDAGGPATG